MQTLKILKYLSAVWMRHKRREEGACESTPVHTVQFHRLLPNKHTLLQIIWPSQQHCHFTSVYPTLTNSTLTHTEGTLAALSRQMQRPSFRLPCQLRKIILTGWIVAMQTQLYFLQCSFDATLSGEVLHFIDFTASSPSCWARLLTWRCYHSFFSSAITPLHASWIWWCCWQLLPACKPCSMHSSV